MARNFNVNGDCTPTSPPKTAVEIVTTAAIRVRIFELHMGCSAAPAAQAALWQLKKHTATGTGPAATPIPYDAQDTPLCSAKVTHSAEPTYVAGQPLWELPLNQQASVIWQAQPGREIILPASATAGAGIRMLTSTGTATHQAALHWEE